MGAFASSMGAITRSATPMRGGSDVLLSPNSKLPCTLQRLAYYASASTRPRKPAPSSSTPSISGAAKVSSGARAEAVCDSLLRWNLAVIEATSDLVSCYKPNIAFYEALGQPGMALLRELPSPLFPNDIPVLLDAKRGDIGSTAAAVRARLLR